MIKDIGGVPFDTSDDFSFTSVDAALTIYGVNEPEQSFSFSTNDIARFKGVFDCFYCVSLEFSAADENDSALDLDLIGHPERIVRLTLDALYWPIELVFTPGRTYFPNLKDLSMVGDCTRSFPDLRSNHHLESLSIDLNRDFTSHWQNLSSLKNLVIHSYEGIDLAPLRGLSSLVRLHMVGGTMHSLDGLELLPQLRVLIIGGAPMLTGLDAILRADKLESIMFSLYRRVSDWSFLARKKNLRHLMLSTVDSIDFRKDLPQLEYLHAKKVTALKDRSFVYESDGLFSAHPDGMVTPYDGHHEAFHCIAPLPLPVPAAYVAITVPVQDEAAPGPRLTLPMLGEVEFKPSDAGDWDFDADSPFGPLALCFRREDDGRPITAGILARAIDMLENLEALDQTARAAIRSEYAIEPSTSAYFVTHHQRNYGPEAVAELFDTDCQDPGVDELLHAISLRTICFHLDDEEGFAVLEYRLRELETDQILVAYMNVSGEVDSIQMES